MKHDSVWAACSTVVGIVVGGACAYFLWVAPTTASTTGEVLREKLLTGEETRFIELAKRSMRREKTEAAAREALQTGQGKYQEMPDLIPYSNHYGPPSRYVRIPVEGSEGEIYVSLLRPDGTFGGLLRLRR